MTSHDIVHIVAIVGFTLCTAMPFALIAYVVHVVAQIFKKNNE